MQIIECLREIYKNYLKVKEYSITPDNKLDYESLRLSFLKRSHVLRTVCKNNDELILEIKELIKTPLTNKNDADTLFNNTKDIYVTSVIADSEVFIPIFQYILDYYENNADYTSAARLYYIINYCYNEYYCRRAGLIGDAKYIDKVIECMSKINEYDLLNVDAYLNSLYYGIIILPRINAYLNDGFPLNKSFDYFLKFNDFYNNKMPLNLKNNERFINLYNVVNENISHLLENNSNKTLKLEYKNILFEIIIKQYNAYYNVNNNVLDVPFQIYYRYLLFLIDSNKLTPIEAYKNYYDYMISNPNFKYNKDEKKVIWPCQAANNASLLLNQVSDKEYRFNEFSKLDKIYKEYIKKDYTDYTRESLNLYLSEWKIKSLEYCKTIEQKEKLIADCFKLSQMPTYLHSIMVEKLSLELFDTLYKNDSSIFKDLNMDYDELKEFVRRSAFFHDFGKIKIPALITNESRRLSQQEFLGIRNHPYFGAKIFMHDSLLNQFSDVLLYHHKWYDGSDGYPNNDSSKSKIKIITDIISICDCLDAATDFMGRNYKPSKPFGEVINEFKDGAGTRYNPYIVNVMINDFILLKRLSNLTTNFRTESMYQAYLKGFIY